MSSEDISQAPNQWVLVIVSLLQRRGQLDMSFQYSTREYR
jgi:hypothetical protein